MAMAIVFAEYGDPEVLHPIVIDPPTAAAGQVRIRVKAAGVNPVDVKLRRGDFADVMPTDFPSRIGNEYAGIIDQIGDDVAGFAAGDQVLGSATGQCYAE